MMIRAEQLSIPTLGPCRIPSPLKRLHREEECRIAFVEDRRKSFFYTDSEMFEQYQKLSEPVPMVELAGPRAEIFFVPEKVKAAIVTCGGLCPGINDVIRGIVMELYYRYGVKDVLGIRYGYRGFIPRYGLPPIALTPEIVKDIHNLGGTILGTSRGQQDVHEILQFLEEHGINQLYVIGGDGTLRAGYEISQVARRKGLQISVIGIPKTIDNDILHIDQSFGFQTAFSEAVKAIESANMEAISSPDCIGLVRFMGRDSGFIASAAALAMNDVNYVLIPEVPFLLNGPQGFLEHLKQRMIRRRHAVIVVSEGAGQEHMQSANVERDASGNVRYMDIGLFLKQRILNYFKEQGMEVNLKYIDPSYMIRSIPASPLDHALCLRMAQSAAHAAMSGRTEMVIGLRNSKLIHLPMPLIAQGRKRVDPRGDLWFAVLEATGQPAQFGCPCCK
jgi:6-phosphofructokinase 1